jgi:hypothetical protein
MAKSSGLGKWAIATAGGAVLGYFAVRAVERHFVRKGEKVEEEKVEGAPAQGAMVGGYGYPPQMMMPQPIPPPMPVPMPYPVMQPAPPPQQIFVTNPGQQRALPAASEPEPDDEVDVDQIIDDWERTGFG